MNLDAMMSFYSRFKSREDASYDLLKFKVNEILLVSSHYDAYIFEQDGVLSEQLIGEFHQLNLSFPPRITHVTTAAGALDVLASRPVDLVILTVRIGDVSPPEAARRIKQRRPDLAVLLLLNNPYDVAFYEQDRTRLGPIDDLFFWSGNSNVFLAMIKSVEDRRNLADDTRNGLVRVILVIEDSAKHGSSFLPLLYALIVRQTQQLISEEVSETARRRRMRMRPKVILVHDFAEAERVYQEYKDYLIGIISDVAFERSGALDEQAGVRFIEMVRSHNRTLPVLIQSADAGNAARAQGLNATFLDKNSPHLLAELRDFIVGQLGFGDFVFRTRDGHEIARAASMQEFMDRLPEVPDDSFLFHAAHNHFSGWLIAHGEVEYAKKIQPMRVEDFATTGALRRYLIEGFTELGLAKNRGRLVVLSEWEHLDRSQVVRLREGSLGGKGRGLAFMNALIHALDLDRHFPGVEVTLPVTAIIGTREFEEFLEHNDIGPEIVQRTDEEIRATFLAGRLSDRLSDRLWRFCERVTTPIAVRSSGLLEDSQSCPLAGVYRTYMLPNRGADLQQRFDEVVAAIKLVYACVFESESRDHVTLSGYKLEEEKMAVVLQEIVGVGHGDTFYPDVSGVAQSHNYYPAGPVKPDDGVASVALGLGRTVVEGRRVTRFCPRFPELDLIAPEELVRGSQRELWAIDLSAAPFAFLEGEDRTLKRLDLKAAESHGTLAPVGSVWDRENERMVDGLAVPGLRVVTFANVLKYRMFPLAELLEQFLTLGQTALGVPVEIEFAANVVRGRPGRARPAFHVLQIRPISVDSSVVDVAREVPGGDPDVLLYSEEALGNGVFEDVADVVFVPPDAFQVTQTAAIRQEVAAINRRMKDEGRRYLLIGPGRWGSRDRFLGIPVLWADISEARVIVESDLESFRVEASQGSHFFHNLVARNVGYLKIRWGGDTGFVHWAALKGVQIVEQTPHCVHARFPRPLSVRMDGRHGHAVVRLPGD